MWSCVWKLFIKEFYDDDDDDDSVFKFYVISTWFILTAIIQMKCDFQLHAWFFCQCIEI